MLVSSHLNFLPTEYRKSMGILHGLLGMLWRERVSPRYRRRLKSSKSTIKSHLKGRYKGKGWRRGEGLRRDSLGTIAVTLGGWLSCCDLVDKMDRGECVGWVEWEEGCRWWYVGWVGFGGSIVRLCAESLHLLLFLLYLPFWYSLTVSSASFLLPASIIYVLVSESHWVATSNFNCVFLLRYPRRFSWDSLYSRVYLLCVNSLV